MLKLNLNSLIMFLKHMSLSLIICIIAGGCSEEKAEKTKAPSDFENVLEESNELLLLLKNNLLVMDSTSIETQAVSQKITLKGNTYRTDLDFGKISLKKVFKCVNNLINVVHFDFYYDPADPSLKRDELKVLALIQANFGQHTSFDSTSSMKTFTWNLSNNILDYELFENGFTFTVRKNKGFPAAIENKLPQQLKLAGLLISYICHDSISFKSTPLEVQGLFKLAFKGKTNSLVFSETYDEKILLSGSFLFSGNKVSAIYFDYVYADSTSKQFMLDSKLIKSKVSKLYGPATEVNTAAYATTYKWSKTPIIIEVYADGFSVLIEKVSL